MLTLQCGRSPTPTNQATIQRPQCTTLVVLDSAEGKPLGRCWCVFEFFATLRYADGRHGKLQVCPMYCLAIALPRGKNSLRFPYVSTFFRSRYLHPRP
jgi:hypothetical protein